MEAQLGLEYYSNMIPLKLMFLSIDMEIQKGYPPFCDGITERLDGLCPVKRNGVGGLSFSIKTLTVVTRMAWKTK